MGESGKRSEWGERGEWGGRDEWVKVLKVVNGMKGVKWGE